MYAVFVRRLSTHLRPTFLFATNQQVAIPSTLPTEPSSIIPRHQLIFRPQSSRRRCHNENGPDNLCTAHWKELRRLVFAVRLYLPETLHCLLVSWIMLYLLMLLSKKLAVMSDTHHLLLRASHHQHTTYTGDDGILDWTLSLDCWQNWATTIIGVSFSASVLPTTDPM